MSKKKNREYYKYFDDKPEKQIKIIDDIVLVKIVHGITGKISILKYTKESYRKYLKFSNPKMLNDPKYF